MIPSRCIWTPAARSGFALARAWQEQTFQERHHSYSGLTCRWSNCRRPCMVGRSNLGPSGPRAHFVHNGWEGKLHRSSLLRLRSFLTCKQSWHLLSSVCTDDMLYHPESTPCHWHDQQHFPASYQLCPRAWEYWCLDSSSTYQDSGFGHTFF